MAAYSLLAQSVPDPRSAWLPVVLIIVIGIAFAVGTVLFSLVIGPARTGPGKESTYESGVVPIGDARRRFNVRFYLVAMIFLVFDVEIVFFYPWAILFPSAVAHASDAVPAGVSAAAFATILLVEMLIFAGILLLAYIYAWGKGVFRWD